MSNPVVTVFGATGAQGGSVVKALLQNGAYEVRGVTRDANSQKADALRKQGVTIIGGNLESDVDVLAAVKDAYAVFLVTDFFSVGEKEYDIGTKVATVAKKAGVKHFVWSTLPNAQEISGGKYHVPHFTGKAKVDGQVMSLDFSYHTFIEVGFYYQNLKTDSQLIHVRPDGVVSFDLPMEEDDYLTGCDVYDTGEAVLTILQEPARWNARRVCLAPYHEPVKEWLREFEELTGKKAVLNTTKPSQLKVHAKELGEMFEYFRECDFFGNHDKGSGWEANPAMKTWPDWLERSDWMRIQ